MLSGSLNTSKGGGGAHKNSSSRLMFDQKEPYIEINFKNVMNGAGVSMRSNNRVMVRDSSEGDFINTLNQMQEEGRIGKVLNNQKSSRQNFKAAKIFTLNDRVIQPNDLRETKLQR
jgi:hypothetical protein